MSEIVEYTFEELKKEMELLSPLYDVVRLVNPFKCEIIDINDTCLTPSDTPISCYDSWKCIFQCINCTSARTLLTGNIQSKLDVSDDTVYHVTSRPITPCLFLKPSNISHTLTDSLKPAILTTL